MGYCSKCGQILSEGSAFCSSCGAPVEIPTEVTFDSACERFKKEEQQFLDDTYRLLRWERTAWSIASKVFIIMGACFMALFMVTFFLGVVASIKADSYGGGIAMGMSLLYAIIYGGLVIGLGIVNKIACNKIPQYLDTLYTDVSLTYNRCGSVGMLVFTAIFGAVSPVFFIINFVRMKSNRSVVARIMKNQKAC